MNLLDAASKVFSTTLNVRDQNFLKKNGHPMHFGATPKVGCSDAVFSLNTLLQHSREHGIDSHVIFIDLAKGYDIIKNEVTSLSLEEMGAPNKYIMWVAKLHRDFEVVLKIRREEISIKHGFGVR